MNLHKRLSMLARAALLAVVVVGVMATGLGITTYTLAKANELVFAQPQSDNLLKARSHPMCLE